MILKSLRLQNFRKFENELIEFPDGVTGIVGLNGAGKSTIFEAIAWVLFGPVAARTSSDQIKREGAKDKDICRVELEFVFEGDNYRIIREMAGKNLTASATVTINGKLAANGADVVSKFIQKKLSMDFKSFYTSIFAKQKELNALSSMNPHERRPLILKMLGINDLDDIISEIRSDIKESNNLIEKYEMDFFDKDGNLKIEVYKKEIEMQKEKKLQVLGLIKKVKDEISKIQKKIELYVKRKNENKIRYEKKLKLKEQTDNKKVLIENKKRLKEEILQFEKEIREIRKKITEKSEQFKKLSNTKYELNKNEERLEENNKLIKSQLKTIEEKKILINQNRKNIDELESKLKEIKKLGSSAICPTCKRVLGEQFKILMDNYNKDLKNKNLEIEKLENEKSKLLEKYNRYDKENIALKRKNNFLHSEVIKLEKLETLINEYGSDVEKNAEMKDKKSKELEKIGEINFDEKKYNIIIKEVQESYREYQKVLEELNKIRNESEKLKIEFEKREGERKLIYQKEITIKQQIEELKKLSKKVDEYKKQVQSLKILNEIMVSFRTYLISKIRPALSSYSSELFYQITEGKYSEIELDENYNLMIYDQGNPYSIERFSGGEEDLANLCIRLAISEVITERAGSVFNFIILDEIFGSQDVFRRQKIINALNRFSSKYRQLFLITHIEDIKNSMENSISVLENEKGISKIKIE